MKAWDFSDIYWEHLEEHLELKLTKTRAPPWIGSPQSFKCPDLPSWSLQQFVQVFLGWQRFPWRFLLHQAVILCVCPSLHLSSSRGNSLPHDPTSLPQISEELVIVHSVFCLLGWSGTSKLLICGTGNLFRCFKNLAFVPFCCGKIYVVKICHLEKSAQRLPWWSRG